MLCYVNTRIISCGFTNRIVRWSNGNDFMAFQKGMKSNNHILHDNIWPTTVVTCWAPDRWFISLAGANLWPMFIDKHKKDEVGGPPCLETRHCPNIIQQSAAYHSAHRSRYENKQASRGGVFAPFEVQTYYYYDLSLLLMQPAEELCLHTYSRCTGRDNKSCELTFSMV